MIKRKGIKLDTLYRLKVWLWQTRKDGCKEVLGHKLQSGDVIVRKWLRKRPKKAVFIV